MFGLMVVRFLLAQCEIGSSSRPQSRHHQERLWQMRITFPSLFYCPKHASCSKFWGWVGLDPIRSFLVLSSSAIPQTNQKGRGQRTSYQEAKVACEEDEEVGRYTTSMENKVEM